MQQEPQSSDARDPTPPGTSSLPRASNFHFSAPWLIGAAFAVCLAAVLAAMGWLTHTALSLDRAREEARCQAGIEENVRLALWRMDSTLAPIVAQESTRPHFAYQPFYTERNAFLNKVEQNGDNNEGVASRPSPLLAPSSQYVLLYFQFGPGGALTSPQVPTGSARERAVASCTPSNTIAAASATLQRFQNLVREETLSSLLPARAANPAAVQQMELAVNNNAPTQQMEVAANDNIPMQSDYQSGKVRQEQRNVNEYIARNTSYQTSQSQALWGNRAPNSVAPLDIALPVATPEVLTPLWVGDALLLARRAAAGKLSTIQGCWLDWDAMRSTLLSGIRDLLPNAALEPVRDGREDPQGRTLAALPVRLIPGALTIEPAQGVSPIRFALAIAWLCGLLAALAVAILLVGAVRLSERRGAFVSAVTHELRTPLTTFRLYTQMLADGMVSGEDKRAHYLNTLRVEADRLSHLVENVLSYAKIERGRAAARVETIACADFLERIRQRLSERAEQAGMRVENAPAPGGEALRMRADTTAVEQIVFNLIDNACKYAAPAADRRIVVSVAAEENMALLRVRDFGPGIAPSDARRLFRPFSKSARDAANSAPGVGLGLALSRRLAREMGGDLRIDASVTDGACFEVSLPRG